MRVGFYHDGWIRVSREEATHTSMALFQLITYPLRAKVSMLTTCTLPRSVPTWIHFDASGRCRHVILETPAHVRWIHMVVNGGREIGEA